MQQCLGISQSVQPEVSEAEAMNVICREHQPLLMVFDSRLKKLQIVLSIMKSKGHKVRMYTIFIHQMLSKCISVTYI